MQRDAWARQQGLELRLWPSTKRTATVGGFVVVVGAGVGGLAHGTLREPGNRVCVTIAAMQKPPRLSDLAWGRTVGVNHRFGTTGVITRVRLPLAPAMAWRDIAAGCPDFGRAPAFGLALGHADGIAKKMCAVSNWSQPSFC